MKSSFITCLCLLALFFQCLSGNAQTSCWAQTIDANDPSWPGTENLTINKAVRLSDGFVVCGTAYQAIFPSRDGNTIGRTNFGGPFVAKYDFAGNLVWLDYGVDSNYGSMSVWSTITSITADANDNIYICGKFPPGSRFYYNNGMSSLKISAIDTTSSAYVSGEFIARLNQQGHPVWHAALYGTRASFLANVANKGVVVAGEIEYYNSGYVKDGDTTTTFVFNSWPDRPQYLYWIDSAGVLLHHAMTSEEANNYRGFSDLETDAAGNVIVTGVYEKSIKFYNQNRTDSMTIASPPGVFYGFKFYAVKYDTTGTVQWKVHDRNDLIATSQTLNGSEPIDVSVAPNGTVYIATQGYLYNYNDTVNFFNADGSIDQIQGGEKMIYSINSNGMLNWNARFYSSYYNGICASDSDVVFAGTRWYYLNYPGGYTDTIYSVNAPDYKVLHSHTPNFHFIRYNAAGTILDAGVIGRAQGRVNYSSVGLLPGISGSYITYGNFSGQSGAEYQQFFNDTLTFNGDSPFMLSYSFNSCDSVGAPYYDPILVIDHLSSDTLCAGQSFVLYNGSTGDFFANAVFKVFLSDASGSFNNAVQIATTPAPKDTLVCIVPAGTSPGNGYRLLLQSSDYYGYTRTSVSYPVTVLSTTPANLSLTAYPNPVLPGTSATFVAHAVNDDNATFRWYLNGSPVPGADNDTFVTSSLNYGDTLLVEMTSSFVCALPKVSTARYILTMTTDIVDINVLDKVSFYPNPSNRTLNLTGEFPAATFMQLILKNMLGQTVYQEENKFSGAVQHLIPLPDLPSGNYLLEYIANGKRKSVKITILRAN